MAILRIGGATDAAGKRFFASDLLVESGGKLFFNGHEVLDTDNIASNTTITAQNSGGTSLGAAGTIRAGSNVTLTVSGGVMTVAATMPTVATSLTSGGTAAVQGKVIWSALSSKVDAPADVSSGYIAQANGAGGVQWVSAPTFTVDTTLTAGGSNAVAGSAIYSAISAHTSSAAIHVPTAGSSGYYLRKTANGTEWAQVTVTVDDALSSSSENPVQNKVIYAAIGTIETQLSNI